MFEFLIEFFLESIYIAIMATIGGGIISISLGILLLIVGLIHKLLST